MSENPPYEPGAAVAAASEVLRQAVRETTATMQSPDTEDLHTLGATLDECGVTSQHNVTAHPEPRRAPLTTRSPTRS